ncbi:DUF4367 domain-containing protein [Mesobacillus maritimus]|uniref:DUF4367 domain-containing protein n=1 Tax=Mesobacillus maritimus TaxID=1643336 RepID=UPI0020407237|nr:DUF4367 domain-containing protein [Mesobacillus maritimus]MCM3671643.1 DUF4367 domain-containing protein [Mesobacillus maritimus]
MLVRIISLVLIFFIPFSAQATEIKYNHDSITVSEVKEKVDFPIFAPDKIPDNWTLEIKTYPMDEEKHFTHFRLHYMDKNDTILKVGIEQRNEPSNKEKFSSPNAEEIEINGNKGFFKAWGNSGEIDKKGELVTGGLLSWIQNGTYIQMNSSRIPKEMMLDIARSMKNVK